MMWLKLYLNSFGFGDYPCFLSCDQNWSWSKNKKVHTPLSAVLKTGTAFIFYFFFITCHWPSFWPWQLSTARENVACLPVIRLPVQTDSFQTQWYAITGLVKTSLVTIQWIQLWTQPNIITSYRLITEPMQQWRITVGGVKVTLWLYVVVGVCAPQFISFSL